MPTSAQQIAFSKREALRRVQYFPWGDVGPLRISGGRIRKFGSGVFEKEEERNLTMKKFFAEFKEFISRGNVMDMAIGVIIATAFGKITTSLVNDVFMPLIGYIIGGVDLSTLNITLSPAVLDEAGEVVKEAVVIGIGTFLTTVIDFILVAFVIFLVVKAFNAAKQKLEKPAEPEPEEPEPSKEELLLTEIRDLLKTKG